MGKVPSAETLSSLAYLTETGRRYLFGVNNVGQPIRFDADGTDNLRAVKFAVFDNDKNYNTDKVFTTGLAPDITGTSDEACLKSVVNLKGLNFILKTGTIPSSSPLDEVVYVTENVTINTQLGIIN